MNNRKSLLMVAWVAAACAANGAEAIRALIVNGQNNHDWVATDGVTYAVPVNFPAGDRTSIGEPRRTAISVPSRYQLQGGFSFSDADASTD